jgi:hypothetical protein
VLAPLDQLDVVAQVGRSRREELRRASGLSRPSMSSRFAAGVLLARLEAHQLVVQQVPDAAEGLAHAERPGDRRAVDLQHRLDLLEQLDRLAHLAVHLVHEGDDRRVAQAADFEQLDGLRFHALGGVDHHHGGVDRGQHAVGVLGEVLVARRVEQVDGVAAVLELHHRAGDRDAALLLHLHPVGGGVARALARLHRAGHQDRAAEQQQLLGQRGLARVGCEMMAKVRRFITAGSTSRNSAQAPVPAAVSYAPWRHATPPSDADCISSVRRPPARWRCPASPCNPIG